MRIKHSTRHKTLTLVWVLLLIPSFLFWRESLLWVIFMSAYANIAGHWSAYEAAKAAESRKEEKESDAKGKDS